MSEIKESQGIVESKEEKKTKKGNKYWKFVIDKKTYNLFKDVEAGDKVGVDDRVKITWTESPNPMDENKPYRNLNAIFLDEETVDIEHDSDEKLARVNKEVDKALFKCNKEGCTETKEHGHTRVSKFEMSTNESIVRQVLYKVAGELLATGTEAAIVNDYVETLERGFYRKGFNK